MKKSRQTNLKGIFNKASDSAFGRYMHKLRNTAAVWALAFTGLMLGSANEAQALGNRLDRNKEPAPKEIKYSTLLQKVDSLTVDNLVISKTGSQVKVSGEYHTDTDTLNFVANVPPGENITSHLYGKDISFTAKEAKESSGASRMLIMLGVMGAMFIGFSLLRGRRAANARGLGGPAALGKSLVKESETPPDVTFDDVAGVDTAKKDLQEIVEFLKDPSRFARLGGRVPRGILMEGPPGTGKTLMAKALAGEAGVPFFSTSGSDFVEMLVGRGAARVRDTFAQAKKKAPCILFIDEIDAIGKERSKGGAPGSNDEREQTINAILAEMDGMNSRDDVIVIAATNRADMLDKALTRPGRFDRKVTVGLPDVRGRKAILEVHANKLRMRAGKFFAGGALVKKPQEPEGERYDMMGNLIEPEKKVQEEPKHVDPVEVFADDVNWEIVARSTPGFSGADLENLLNEAAIFAGRRYVDKIGQQDIEDARDKVMMGPASNTAVSAVRKELVAWHEAAHTVVAYALKEHASPIHKVTLIPRGSAAGALWHLPREDEIHSMAHLKADMAVAMAGRMGEELLYGEGNERITAGAQSDIRQATMIADKMVTEWGMSPLGMRNYKNLANPAMTATQTFGKAVGDQVDAEINKLLSDAIETARTLLKKYKNEHKALVDALYEYETLDARDVDLIMQGKPLDRSPLGDERSVNDNNKPRPSAPGKTLGMD